MKFNLQCGEFAEQDKNCPILGIFENHHLLPTTKKVDQLSHGLITKLLKQGDFEGKVGQTLMLFAVPGMQAERVLLVGCGKGDTASDRDFRKIIHTVTKALSKAQVSTVISYLTELPVTKRDLAWKVKQTVEVSHAAGYRFENYKTKKSNPEQGLKNLIIHVPGKTAEKSLATALQQGIAIAHGVEFTKRLGDLPSNICTPTYLAKEALSLVKKYPTMKAKVLDEDDMEKLGMGALLAVAQGSEEPAKLICVEYKGGKKSAAPFAIVGKGITFDTGGISLKPSEGMVGMKYDMCGAATVLGTLKAAADLKLPINLVGIMACAENMPSGSACKPEDVVTTMSGITVEILNTDCEGRLVLADALTYVAQFKPQAVIDVATLTGAALIALGTTASILVGNDDKLAQELLTASEQSSDRAWQLPMWEEYQELIETPYADVANLGRGRLAGSITAACFLSRFAKNYKWAHLDVAGTAAFMMGAADRAATGRPVPLLMQYLINQSK